MADLRGKRLTIIGGGVMGLMTAYHAAPLASVTVLEKTRVGDPATASFSLTRSARNDYLDPEYARLAVRSPGSSGSTCRRRRPSRCWSTAAA